MKKHVLGCLLFISSFSLVGQEAAVVVDSSVHKEFEIAPMFTGCELIGRNTHERLVCASELLHNFIYDNLQYPAAAMQSKTQGIVVVNFVVEKDGSISNCKATNFLDQNCNQEALRIAQSMPAWLPAELKGSKVRSAASIAVRFKLLQDGTVYRPPFVAPKPQTATPTAEVVEKQKTPADPAEAVDKQEPTEEPWPEAILGQEIFKVVKFSPYFPGCEDVEDPREKRECAEAKMLKFIYSNVKYPQKARDEKIEGTVYLSFIVGLDGGIYSPKLERDIGGGCGEEALRVVAMMPKWEPGMQGDRKVNVQFNLPVKFRL